jgi:tricorn protease
MTRSRCGKATKVYFRSDRDGEFNLYSYDPTGKSVTQLTSSKISLYPAWKEPPTRSSFRKPATYMYNTSSNQTTRLKVGIAADLLDHRSRYVKGDQYIRSGDISPSGAPGWCWISVERYYVALPAKRRCIQPDHITPGIHEKEPSWSPNGKLIAYLSDASGEYELHVKNQDGSTQPQVIKMNGSGFYNVHLHWSPDSKKIALCG